MARGFSYTPPVTRPAPEKSSDAEVLLRLEVQVPPEKREDFLAFCRRAFPVYESIGGCRMALYEDRDRPGCFDELGWYATAEDLDRAETALREDPVQAALIRQWRGLLSAPPKVSIHRRST